MYKNEMKKPQYLTQRKITLSVEVPYKGQRIPCTTLIIEGESI